MTQGTVSILIGCHSIVHSFLVLKAWIKLYKRLPKGWQIVCIFLHDIGHLGLNYLDDYNQKKTHWRLGSRLAYKLFGAKGYLLVAGHCTHSQEVKSKLYFADKFSWVLAPTTWLLINTIFEPKLMLGSKTRKDAVSWFQDQVKENARNNFCKSTHGFYLQRSQLLEEENGLDKK